MRIYSLALVILVSVSALATAASSKSEPSSSNARAAAQVYRRYCVSCHGNDGKAKTSKGKYSHARDLTEAQWQTDVSDERIFNSIMNGRNVRGNMPSFANKLKDKEVESLVSFIRGLKS
jgi:mono/diheme cytochrome c family protein